MNKLAWTLATAGALVTVGTPAEAAYTFTFAQVGADVVVTGSGSFKTGGFGSLVDRTSDQAFVEPGLNTILSGGKQSFNFYDVSLSGIVAPWGLSGDTVFDGSGSGSPVYFNALNLTDGRSGNGLIGVPLNYKSGADLASSATFANQTLQSMGLKTGNYSYSYASGTNFDVVNVVVPKYTVVTPTPAVPEPATWAMMLVGFAMVGAASRCRRRGTKVTYA